MYLRLSCTVYAVSNLASEQSIAVETHDVHNMVGKERHSLVTQ